jgi:hypothetical protein
MARGVTGRGRRIGLALVACAACGGTPAPAAGPAEPRPLTPADVGLPEVPPEEPHAARVYVPTPPDPHAYYRREACPPVRGCQFTREITADGIATRYSCRPGSGLRSFYPLRTLELVEVLVQNFEGSLDRATIRRVLSRHVDTWKHCFDKAGISASVRIRGSVSRSGDSITADITGTGEPEATCLRETLSKSTFPSATFPTPFEAVLDYQVTSPTTVPPLECQ